MRTGKMNKQVNRSLNELVELSREVRMTADDRAAQRISFAYGTAHIENSNVTRQMVIDAAKKPKLYQD